MAIRHFRSKRSRVVGAFCLQPQDDRGGRELQLVQETTANGGGIHSIDETTTTTATSTTTTTTYDEEEEYIMDEYAVTLAEFLDRKELLIRKLQSKLVEFKRQLNKEQELAQRVQTLTQY